ncbi:septal ring factor EnvC (AmiA/AmiB activator) [Bartonella silvatica]|uniref:Septal ring factor EnvC (AmiA/AmiB activator) n=1 Tax=Bartonella silvatica TaxID=357760 RepID=A0ABV2HIP6_9HYPH
MITQERYMNTPRLVAYLSNSAVKLLDIHAMLLKVRESNMGEKANLLRQIDSTRKQLDEISHALILEYRERQENERFLKQILLSISDQLFSLNNGFKETGRLVFQEMRVLQSQIQCFYEGKEKQRLLESQESCYSSSKIDEVIKQLQKAREKLIIESPHLFEREY